LYHVAKITPPGENLHLEMKRLQEENNDLQMQLQQEKLNSMDMWQQLQVAKDALARRQQTSTFGLCSYLYT
jgi:hypothetical protein